ncbi:hypothetical protein VTJ04DRAFT_8689 [Mycothermus thermophilus]|uniref:uncharacterized protein n=1 Tax=Humicola insolens TaxID=85995 RepID=UPI00374461B4
MAILTSPPPGATPTPLPTAINKRDDDEEWPITSFPYIPLTTTFTRPANCGGVSSSMYRGTSAMTWRFQIDAQSTCLPRDFSRVKSGYYSPGLVCPSGYWTACIDNFGEQSITTVTCCPTYTYETLSFAMTCAEFLRVLDQGLHCRWAPTRTTSWVRVTDVDRDDDGFYGPYLRTYDPGEEILAVGVRMVYQSTDLAFATTGDTMTTSTSSTRNAGSSPKPSSSSSASSVSYTKELSPALIATITICSVLVAVLGFILYGRLSKRRQPKPQEEAQLPSSQPEGSPSTADETGMASVAGTGRDAAQKPEHQAASPVSQIAEPATGRGRDAVELDGKKEEKVVELGGTKAPAAELDARREERVVELDATREPAELAAYTYPEAVELDGREVRQ